MEYVDKLAEQAVKEAIAALLAGGQRAYSGNVPTEAGRLLMKKARGRVAQPVAAAKVGAAIDRLRARKEIKAPPARQHDWVLLKVETPAPPAPTSASELTK
jgi:hypothetical protein